MKERKGKSVLHHRSFLKVWLARIFSSLAFQMLTVAIGWQMYEITNNAFDLGLVGLAEFLPMLLLTLVVGQVADRFDRRKVVFICQIVEGIIALFLIIATQGGWIDRNHMLIAAAVLGASRAFESPASSALVPSIVPRSLLPEAAAWSASAGQAASIIGPSLGGVLYGFGSAAVLIPSAVALFISAFLILSAKLEVAFERMAKVDLKTLFTGFHFIFKRKIILGTISLDLFAVLLGGATALLPIFTKDILHASSWALGVLRSAPALGALLMSLYLARHPMKNNLGRSLFSALAVFGIATILFGISKNIYVSIIALFLTGASDMISVVIRSTLVQINTPLEMQGRVSAVNNLFVGTSNQLGEFESGTMAGFFGPVAAAVIGGVGTLVIAGLWMTMFPSLRRLKGYTVEEQH